MMLGVAPNDDRSRGGAVRVRLALALGAASAAGAGVLSTPMRRSTASAARSPDSQAPPTVPHSVSWAASPANQIVSPTGSIMTRRASWAPGTAADAAPRVHGSAFQRVTAVRPIAFLISE